MKTIVLFLLSILFFFMIGCGNKNTHEPGEEFAKVKESASDYKINYSNIVRYEKASFTYNDKNESIEISAVPVGFKFNELEPVSAASEAVYKVAMKLDITVDNLSSKYTFNGFTIGNWFLYDGNNNKWELFRQNNKDDCGPGESKTYSMEFGSPDYDSAESLPDKLILKIAGGFAPIIHQTRFDEELVFEKK